MQKVIKEKVRIKVVKEKVHIRKGMSNNKGSYRLRFGT